MAGKTKVKTTGRQRSEFIWGWLFILPTVIGLIVLNIIPIFQTIYRVSLKPEISEEEMSLLDLKIIRKYLPIKKSGRH